MTDETSYGKKVSDTFPHEFNEVYFVPNHIRSANKGSDFDSRFGDIAPHDKLVNPSNKHKRTTSSASTVPTSTVAI